ncbi:zinc finger protein 675-like isoform X3 [Anthonomus grandis grandis]|uniref:zinc finger protein 675-like isoform X3 n=1 Tax=Anthonomus grandis grandis TaxID=2921223 RepID=UPI002166617A|nr:zinc finger protein 675-like isoform X3 [Anthonomus grandis grandis]
MIIMEDNRSMTFHSSELSSTMFHKLYEQKRTNRFCDVTLYVNNKILKAHRNVLASSSPYFDSILKHHKVVKEQLTVNCLDSEIFTNLLNYMYTGEITIKHANVEELLKLADHFILTKVIEYCIEFLGTKLSLDNCLFTYFLTQRFKLRHLGNIVENWISSHIDSVCEGEEIGRLSSKELQDFFRNKNFILTTQKALVLLSKWMLLDLERREKYFDKLVRCFYTNNFEPAEVFKHLDTCILYTKSEICLFRFLDYLAQNNWTLSSFKTRYEVLQAKYGQINDSKHPEPENMKPDRIIVSEKCENNVNQNILNSIKVKARLKDQKRLILKKLMLFGLKPSLRMAALKMLTCRKQRIILSDNEKEESEDNDDNDEKVGIKCPICFATINDSLLLEQHLALSHAKDVTYKCGICSFVCQYHGDYLNHMKTHFTGPPFKCDYCEFGTDQISKLITHRAQHLDESIYQCTFCSFKCRQKQNYISHMKIHTPDKTYKCEHCSKAFRFKQNLEAHHLTHSMEKNLSCDTCGFHTKFLSNMVAHKRIHSGIKTGEMFRCSYPHCKYSTSKKNQLAVHSKTHNSGSSAGGARPHACSVCGRGFMEKSHLVRHERIHLEEKPFKCSNCDYASSRRDKLKEHFTRHHGENASAKVPYKARPLRNGTSATSNTSRSKSQSSQESAPAIITSGTTNSNTVNFTQTPSSSTNPTPTVTGSEIQDLVHHQNQTTSSAGLNGVAYQHHFTEHAAEFHHAHTHAHNIHNQLLATSAAAAVVSHNQRSAAVASATHNNNHVMLARSNHSTATSTAAAVAAAMMLDPRFHHNTPMTQVTCYL